MGRVDVAIVSISKPHLILLRVVSKNVAIT